MPKQAEAKRDDITNQQNYHFKQFWTFTPSFGRNFLLRCIHHFKLDLINNMDHMRISGNETSSVILSQKSIFKSWKEVSQTCKKQAEAKRDGILQFQTILNIYILLWSKLSTPIISFSDILELQSPFWTDRLKTFIGVASPPRARCCVANLLSHLVTSQQFRHQ